MTVFVEKIASFTPSAEAPTPGISFVPMLTRRRLSPLAKLVVFVNHEVSCDLPPTKVTFASQFGEISQQLKISQLLLDSGTVSPAHFSQSVFNASIANASILEKNTAGYSAVFSGKESFKSGLKDCIAALQIEGGSERTFIFADELIPETYAPVAGVTYPNKAFALALRLTTDESKAVAALPDFLEQDFETAADEAITYFNTIVLK